MRSRWPRRVTASRAAGLLLLLVPVSMSWDGLPERGAGGSTEVSHPSSWSFSRVSPSQAGHLIQREPPQVKVLVWTVTLRGGARSPHCPPGGNFSTTCPAVRPGAGQLLSSRGHGQEDVASVCPTSPSRFPLVPSSIPPALRTLRKCGLMRSVASNVVGTVKQSDGFGFELSVHVKKSLQVTPPL